MEILCRVNGNGDGARISTYIDAEHAIAHNKIIIIIDRSVAITGSFNFAKAAEEKNAENDLFIRSKELAKPYLDNRQRHRGRSTSWDHPPSILSVHFRGESIIKRGSSRGPDG